MLKRGLKRAFLLAFFATALLGFALLGEKTKAKAASVEINSTNFPDENFREYISEEFDDDKNGVLSEEEIEDATYIDLYYVECKSLEGISFFTNLKNLDCWGIEATSVDLRNNKELTSVYMYYNKIDSVNVNGLENLGYLTVNECELKSIDVGSCTALQSLSCDGNGLPSIDVTDCIDLIELDLDENQLTSIDLRNCTKLEMLYLGANPITEIDLSNCTELTYLNLGEDQLTSLNLSNCTKLTGAMLYGNHLTSLDVSTCKDLLLLCIYENDLTSLDISNCSELEELYCYGNQLTELDLSYNVNLNFLNASENGIQSLNISNCPYLLKAYAAGTENPGYYSIFEDDGEGHVSYYYLITDPETSIIADEIKLVIIKQPSDITLYNGSTAIFMIDVFGENPMFSWQSSTDGGSTWKNSSLNGYNTTSLSVPGTMQRNGYLFRCIVTDNKGVKISSDAAKLTVLDDSDLINIDEANFPDEIFREYIREKFDEDGNNRLDPEEIASVKSITIKDKGCSSLKGIRFFTEVEQIDCSGNNLTELDVSGCSKLIAIECKNNKLTSVNISGCQALMGIDIEDNEFTDLDFSSCKYMMVILCGNNKLTSLDVSPYTNLMCLGAQNNLLTGLDISKNIMLQYLVVYENALDVLDISKCPELIKLYNTEPKAPGHYVGDSERLELWVDSDVKIITEYTEPKITSQPTDKVADLGATVEFKVAAEGIDLKYKWQASKDGGATWLDSSMTGCKTNTLSVAVAATRNGYKFRCIITDIKGVELISEKATLTVKGSAQITLQPADVTAKAGDNVEFHVEATGSGLKYQWQASKDKGVTWTNSGMTGNKTDTLTVQAIASRNGYKFRCVITDGNNVSVKSNAATLTVSAATTLAITSQPADVTTPAGKDVTFSVTATGTGLKYQWQASKDKGVTWTNSGMTGNKTNTLTVSAIASRNGYQFRCIVTDSAGKSVTSNAAKLTIGSSTTLAITSQPADVTTPAGKDVTFSVTATGAGLKYQWQASKDKGATWTNSGMTGNKTATLTVSAIASRNGYQFRCIVTDKNGKTVTSNAAKLTVISATELAIISHPANVTAKAGTDVKFSVTANGLGLKYQWQASKDGGKTWTNSGMTGNKTATLTVSAIVSRNGYQFRCIVTDKNGKTVTSNAGTLTVTK